MAKPDHTLDFPTLNGTAVQAVLYGEQLLEDLLQRQRFAVRKDSEYYHQLRQSLVYCIHETTVPSRQILLNRNYKPIGSLVPAGQPYVDYDAATSRHVFLSDLEIAQFGTVNSPGYLFLDDTKPWLSRKMAERYLAETNRLKALLSAARR